MSTNGTAANVDLSESKQGELRATTYSITVLAAVFVALRFAARMKRGVALRIDDWMLVVALVRIQLPRQARDWKLMMLACETGVFVWICCSEFTVYEALRTLGGGDLADMFTVIHYGMGLHAGALSQSALIQILKVSSGCGTLAHS